MDKDIIAATIVTAVLTVFSLLIWLLKWCFIIAIIVFVVWAICLLFGVDIFTYIGGMF